MEPETGAPPPMGAVPPGLASVAGLSGPPKPMPTPYQLSQAEEDEKSKVSRWQIGSSSLSVLEQVYTMDPFPGARKGSSEPRRTPSRRQAPVGATPLPRKIRRRSPRKGVNKFLL